jgi:hypothetical protein
MLHSSWLLRMLDKSADTPRGRVLALFDIMADWNAAPGLNLSAPDRLMGNEEALIAYLTRELNALQLREPDILATQIYFIAMGALQTAGTQESGNVFVQARQAAAILVDAHRPPRRLKSAATVLSTALLVLGAALFVSHVPQPVIAPATLANLPSALAPASLQTTAIRTSPAQVASLNDSLERMRQGVCQYPQALMLAPEARAVLLDNVVNGSAPTDAESLREAHRLAQAVECYYAPAAMTAL